MAWLPDGFVPPARHELRTGHHLRPIRAADIDLDYRAVMGSQARLWETFGRAWGWPPATMTREQDLEDLVRHEEEMVARSSFNYAIFDRDETELLGCVYVDPPKRPGGDADVSWWVVDAHAGGPLEQAVADELPAWIASAWPFAAPRFMEIETS